MRSPSEDLFKLIKAMNKGEKRNFKLLAGMMTGEKKYIDLFDLVDKQTNYDESKILKSGISRGQLSVAKNYLYKFLLKSLVYNRPNVSSELALLKEQVRILLAKKLYRQAGKLLRKAIQQAKGLEAWEILLELIGIQSQLLLVTLKDNGAAEKLYSLRKEQQIILEKLSQLHELTFLHNQVQLLHNRRLKLRGPNETEQLALLKAHPIVQNDEPEGSVRAKLVYLKIKRKLCSYEGLPEEALLFGSRILEVYNSSEAFLKMEVGDYFQEVSNLCTYYFRAGREKEAFQLMELFSTTKERFKNCEVEFFQRYYLLQMAYAIHTGSPNYGLSFLDDMQQELGRVREKIPSAHLQWLFYEVAYLYLLNGQFEKSSEWLRKFSQVPRSEYLSDLPGFARLLKLLVYFEMEHFSLLETELVNTQRYLDRSKNHSDYEYGVLTVLKSLLKGVGLGRGRQIFREAGLQFQGIIVEGGGRYFDDLLNFELWLKSKESGLSMASVRKLELATVG